MNGVDNELNRNLHQKLRILGGGRLPWERYFLKKSFEQNFSATASSAVTILVAMNGKNCTGSEFIYESYSFEEYIAEYAGRAGWLKIEISPSTTMKNIFLILVTVFACC